MNKRVETPQPAAAIETPCVKICIVDKASGLCTGCGRSVSEIGRWSSLTSTERRRIMAELPTRLAGRTGRTSAT